jgi:hypothetical protein
VSSARTPPSYERFPVPDGAVVRAWHRGQDNLRHRIEKIVLNVPAVWTSGLNEGKNTYAHRFDTACGWVVYQTTNDATPFLRGTVDCIGCLVDGKDEDDE